MRIGRLFLQLTLFYLIVTGTVLLIDALFPDFEHFLPIGGAEGLLAGDGDPFDWSRSEQPRSAISPTAWPICRSPSSARC